MKRGQASPLDNMTWIELYYFLWQDSLLLLLLFLYLSCTSALAFLFYGLSLYFSISFWVFEAILLQARGSVNPPPSHWQWSDIAFCCLFLSHFLSAFPVAIERIHPLSFFFFLKTSSPREPNCREIIFPHFKWSTAWNERENGGGGGCIRIQSSFRVNSSYGIILPPLTLPRTGHIFKLNHQASRRLIRDGFRSAGLSELHNLLAQTVCKSTTMALWCDPIKQSHYLGKFAFSHILTMQKHQPCGVSVCALVQWKKSCSLCKCKPVHVSKEHSHC